MADKDKMAKYRTEIQQVSHTLFYLSVFLLFLHLSLLFCGISAYLSFFLCS